MSAPTTLTLTRPRAGVAQITLDRPEKLNALTAAMFDELTATVRQTAESARLANQATEQVKTEAEQSTSIVRDAVTAMGCEVT